MAIKFTEWRPIGVCDTAPPNQMKAQIFSEADLVAIRQLHVSRDNWQHSPQLLKIIHRYAKKVAKLSTITASMKQPVVDEIQLVGMVLQYGKTPGLNRESEDGKVQLFQVTYRDQASVKGHSAFPWKSLLVLVGVLLLAGLVYIGWQQWSSQREDASLQRVPLCSVRRSAPAYVNHLQQAKQGLTAWLELHSLARDPQVQNLCWMRHRALSQQETQLLQCYTKLNQKNTSPRPPRQLKTCVAYLCKKSLDHLQRYCR